MLLEHVKDLWEPKTRKDEFVKAAEAIRQRTYDRAVGHYKQAWGDYTTLDRQLKP